MAQAPTKKQRVLRRTPSARHQMLLSIDTGYEDWANRKWRPYTAWTYLVICIFDFMLAPMITFYFFGGNGHASYTQWQPITLVGSGLFHIAMGAIIGVTAWQRGEEKKYVTPYPYPPDHNESYNRDEPHEQYEPNARDSSREN